MKRKIGTLISSGLFLMASIFFVGCLPKEGNGKDVGDSDKFNHSIESESDTESTGVFSTVVHFNSNGGSPVRDTVLFYGKDVGLLPVPTKTEYRFIGWKYKDGSEIKFIDPSELWTSAASTAEFVAEWTPVEYTITLNTNGGAVENFDAKYTKEEGKVLPTPTFEGYTFKGWYNDASFAGNPITKIETGEAGNKTYYAKWEEAEYTVTLNYGCEGDFESEEVKITYNKLFSLPVPINREKYIFNGWKTVDGIFYTDESGRSAEKWETTENTELIADWVERKTEEKKSDDGRLTYETLCRFGEQEFLDTLKVREGYKFLYFSLEGGITFKTWKELLQSEEKDIYKVYVHFEKERDFLINYLDVTADEVTASLIRDFDEPITLLSMEKEGYVFDGWYIADIEYNRKYFLRPPLKIGEKFDFDKMPDLSPDAEEDGAAIFLEARFTPANGDGTFIYKTECKAGDQEFLDRMKMKEGYKFLYFTLKDGTKFKSWKELPKIEDQGDAYEVSVHFVREINFTIDCLENEEMNTWYEPIIKPFGEEIELPMIHKEGYTFDGWYVMDHEYNRTHFTGTQFSIGSKFEQTKMPDLSVGKEEDGTHIKLEARFTPIKETEKDISGFRDEIILDEPMREGYTFGGGYKKAEYNNECNFDKDNLPQETYDENGERNFVETKLYAKEVSI